MITVRINLLIQHPADRTFSFISNFENNPKWQDGMVSCTFSTDEPFGIGSRYEQKARFLGNDIVSTFEVIEYEPGRRVKATTIASSFPITFTRIVEPEGSHARVQAIIEGEPKGFFKLFRPLMRWMVNRSINRDYQKLKKLLEENNDSLN